MDETYADVILKANKKQIKRRLLVDTIATYSWIKSAVLKRLGVKILRVHGFETIEGKIVKKSVGEIEIECKGNTAHTIVVFADKNDSEVLGLHALEGLALEVDPINRKLKNIKAIKALYVMKENGCNTKRD